MSYITNLWATKYGQYDQKDSVLAQNASYPKDYQQTLKSVSNRFNLKDNLLYHRNGKLALPYHLAFNTYLMCHLDNLQPMALCLQSSIKDHFPIPTQLLKRAITSPYFQLLKIKRPVQ